MEVRKIFEYALHREHEGRRFFEHNAQRMTHVAVVAVFRRLAEEEGRRIELIEAQIAALNGGHPAGGERGVKATETGGRLRGRPVPARRNHDSTSVVDS